MLGFLRRHTGGRHSLGAAVTAIPSAPRRVAVPEVAVAVPEVAAAVPEVAAAVPEVTQAAPLPVAAPEAEPQHAPRPGPPRFAQPAAPPQAAAPNAPAPVAPELPAPRVELGFRDGSTAVLDPCSAQAGELLALAGLLHGRSGAPQSSVTGSRPRQPR